MTEGQVRSLRQKEWITRSSSWTEFGGIWKGVKILGQGEYGIAGLFKYTGQEKYIPIISW